MKWRRRNEKKIEIKRSVKKSAGKEENMGNRSKKMNKDEEK